MAVNHSSGKRDGHNGKPSYRHHTDDAIESPAVSQATRGDGGAGGISGTGQAFPHHGFDDSIAKDALGNPAGDEAALPMPENGSTYQTGGSHLHRERQEQLRKARLAGSSAASQGRGPADPAPGAPVDRDPSS
ncbi:hypothetical protein ISP15_15690 [Dyella jejuensis]|uniref:Uncharacterized protein n=1 Tax=Dyella jejuensis TaxID=1432009 RepID=A0ABW8JNE6_9GAMM